MNTTKRGFAAMSEEKHREIASKGGKAAHANGTAHTFTKEDAAVAGRKGGKSHSSEHMAEIGRKGGKAHSKEHMAEIGRKGGNAHSKEHMQEIGRNDAREYTWRVCVIAVGESRDNLVSALESAMADARSSIEKALANMAPASSVFLR